MQKNGLKVVRASCFVMFEGVYSLGNEFIIYPGKVKEGTEGCGRERGRGSLGRVFREVLIHQGLQGCPNRGGGRTIRKCEIAYRVGVDFMLHYLRE